MKKILQIGISILVAMASIMLVARLVHRFHQRWSKRHYTHVAWGGPRAPWLE